MSQIAITDRPLACLKLIELRKLSITELPTRDLGHALI